MSSTDRGRISIIRQASPAIIPDEPDWQIARVTSASLAFSKETTVSNELDASAQPGSTIKIGAKSAGGLPFEWSAESFDALVEVAVRGTFDSTINATGAAVIENVARTVTLAGAFTDAKAGQFVLLSGFVVGESYTGANDSPNNGWYEIESVTGANDVVLKDPGAKLLDETGPVTAQVKSKRVINGTVMMPHAIEEGFLDTGSFLCFLGQYINTMSMSMTAGQIVTGEFGFMGSDVVDEQVTIGDDPSWTLGGSYLPASTTSPMNATSNVGEIIIDGALSTACFRTLTLSLTNNLRETPCIGSEFPRIDYGTPACTGNFEKVFIDLDLWRKMRDHDDMSLRFGFVSPDKTSGIHVTLPRVNINSNTVDLSGGRNSDVFDKVDWNAQKYTNPVTNEIYYIQICVA